MMSQYVQSGDVKSNWWLVESAYWLNPQVLFFADILDKYHHLIWGVSKGANIKEYQKVPI